MTKIVCISDTHHYHTRIDVPDGDILIHAGDIGCERNFQVLYDFNEWLKTLPHTHKLIIPGNHELWMPGKEAEAKAIVSAGHLLIDEAVWCEGLKIYGSPWQPYFFDWAYNLPRGDALKRVWSWIPDDTNVLITHGPPYGRRDLTLRGERVGCLDLSERIKALKKLKLHVYGHIHPGYGMETHEGITYVNASICTEWYDPSNLPIVVEVENDNRDEEEQDKLVRPEHADGGDSGPEESRS